MSFETWLAFAAASTVLLVIPGPTILLVISYALGQGRRAAFPVATGVALGDFTAMSLSMLGLGALLATSAELFTLLKWVGGAYLIWLGIKLIRAGGRLGPVERRAAEAPGRMIAHAWIVTALNPKGLTFFIAFLPQFLDPSRNLGTQMAIFEVTFLVLATANAFGYAALASRARGLVKTPAVVTWFNRIGGSLLIGAGITAVAWNRTA
jgi:threonine/homoserine/homoserine lactone efflux protein